MMKRNIVLRADGPSRRVSRSEHFFEYFSLSYVQNDSLKNTTNLKQILCILKEKVILSYFFKKICQIYFGKKRMIKYNLSKLKNNLKKMENLGSSHL